MTHPRPPSLMMLPALAALAALAACSGGGGTVAGLSDNTPEPLFQNNGSTGGPVETNADIDGYTVLLNDSRDTANVASVVYNTELGQASGDHAEDLVENGIVADVANGDKDLMALHVGSNGSNYKQRATEAGYDWSYISENVASGFPDEESVHEAWLNSQYHRENMLDERAEDFGLARYDDTWVLMLGAEK